MQIKKASILEFTQAHAEVSARTAGMIGEKPDSRALLGLDRQRYRDQQQAFVAKDSDLPVAVCVGRLSTVQDGSRLGCIGFFAADIASVAAPEGTAALLSATKSWLSQHGAQRVLGPMQGDTWFSYRFNLGPFKYPAFPLEPSQPPEYPALWQRAGWKLVEHYFSTWIEDAAATVDGLEREAIQAAEMGYRIRQFRTDQFEQELGVLFQLSSNGFDENRLFSPIEKSEFLALYQPLKAMVRPEYLLIAESRDGEPVGYVFSYPHPDAGAICAKSLVVAPEHRRRGLAGALMHQTGRTALDAGLRHAIHCLMYQDNPSQKLAKGQGVLLRRYGLFGPPEGQA